MASSFEKKNPARFRQHLLHTNDALRWGSVLLLHYGPNYMRSQNSILQLESLQTIMVIYAFLLHSCHFYL